MAWAVRMRQEEQDNKLKHFEEARENWERRGIKIIVGYLREESFAGVMWIDTSKQFSIDGWNYLQWKS